MIRDKIKYHLKTVTEMSFIQARIWGTGKGEKFKIN